MQQIIDRAGNGPDGHMGGGMGGGGPGGEGNSVVEMSIPGTKVSCYGGYCVRETGDKIQRKGERGMYI